MRHHGLLFLLIISGSYAAGAQQLTPPNDTPVFAKNRLALPPHFYTQHLGFFCKQEWQLQKRTAVNVFFRLGSKEYVDYLERKPNARKF